MFVVYGFINRLQFFFLIFIVTEQDYELKAGSKRARKPNMVYNNESSDYLEESTTETRNVSRVYY